MSLMHMKTTGQQLKDSQTWIPLTKAASGMSSASI